jgi:hypothetical protein
VPNAGSLDLVHFFFNNIEKLESVFMIRLKDFIFPQIKIRADYGLILLPSNLKGCLPENLLKMDESHPEHINHDR